MIGNGLCFRIKSYVFLPSLFAQNGGVGKERERERMRTIPSMADTEKKNKVINTTCRGCYYDKNEEINRLVRFRVIDFLVRIENLNFLIGFVGRRLPFGLGPDEFRIEGGGLLGVIHHHTLLILVVEHGV